MHLIENINFATQVKHYIYIYTYMYKYIYDMEILPTATINIVLDFR